MTVLSDDTRQAKLRELASDFGHPTVERLLEIVATDSVVPAICVRNECDYTTVMEPNQRKGYCEACRNRTVQSALVLAGLT